MKTSGVARPIALIARAVALGLCLVGPLAAESQQPLKVWRIGSLVDRSRATGEPTVTAFRQGLLQSGVVEGRDVAIDYRYSDGNANVLPMLASQLVRANVDLIFANGTVAALAAREATRSIPIVFAAVGDPVGAGLVDSLDRPGGNLTGLSSANAELVAKRLQLLKEISPRAVSRVGVLVNPADVSNTLTLRALDGSARILGIALVIAEVRSPDVLEVAWVKMASAGVQAVFVAGGVLTNDRAKQIVQLAARTRLPAIYSGRPFVEDGGLMSYTVDFLDQYRQAGVYAAKIIKGAKPAEVPVEQPTKFELVINRRTAKSLGLVVPPSLLLQADHVIE